MNNIKKLLTSALEDDNKLGIIIGLKKYGPKTLFELTKDIGVMHQYWYRMTKNTAEVYQLYNDYSDEIVQVVFKKTSVIPDRFKPKYNNR